MSHATFRFYAELNDDLPLERRMTSFNYKFDTVISIKNAIESLGVFINEVDLILVNGESVDLSYVLKDGDGISVYPVFETLDISQLVKIRSKPLRRTRFVLDVHLGKLAAYLRTFGFDSSYHKDFNDEDLITISNSEERILLSKDRDLFRDPRITRGYRIKSDGSYEQLREVLQRFDLSNSIHPFTRCLRCNTELMRISKEEIIERLPEKVKKFFPRRDAFAHEFWICRSCNRLYWKGSHYEKMKKMIDEFLTMIKNTI